MSVIIIGAGASGMMAAIMARKQGSEVVLLEHLKEPGKKILATGNGKCNFTNRFLSMDNYPISNPQFVEEVIKQFTNEDIIQYFFQLGVLSKEKNGYCYPNSSQAASIRDALWNECYHLGVDMELQCEIKSISRMEQEFVVRTNKSEFKAQSLIFACGLLASANLGSDGSAFQYIERFGHKIKDIVPGLVQMKSEQSIFKNLAGIRSDVSLELWNQNQKLYQDQGELQLTNYGVSGIVSFQASLIASKYLHEKKEVYLNIDFVPSMSEEELGLFVHKLFLEKKYLNHKSKLAGLISDKLARAILIDEGIVPESKKDLTLNQINEIIHRLKSFRVDLTGVKGFEECQVCLGGISLDEIDSETMMSKYCPGLFFAGEVVDVVGQCGGYNLQWAWSSGYVAGRGAATYDNNFINKGEL